VKIVREAEWRDLQVSEFRADSMRGGKTEVSVLRGTHRADNMSTRQGGG
jgi:hypothetical protein